MPAARAVPENARRIKVLSSDFILRMDHNLETSQPDRPAAHIAVSRQIHCGGVALVFRILNQRYGVIGRAALEARKEIENDCKATHYPIGGCSDRCDDGLAPRLGAGLGRGWLELGRFRSLLPMRLPLLRQISCSRLLCLPVSASLSTLRVPNTALFIQGFVPLPTRIEVTATFGDQQQSGLRRRPPVSRFGWPTPYTISISG
jgi:hypothetical protein